MIRTTKSSWPCALLPAQAGFPHLRCQFWFDLTHPPLHLQPLSEHTDVRWILAMFEIHPTHKRWKINRQVLRSQSLKVSTFFVVGSYCPKGPGVSVIISILWLSNLSTTITCARLNFHCFGENSSIASSVGRMTLPVLQVLTLKPSSHYSCHKNMLTV